LGKPSYGVVAGFFHLPDKLARVCGKRLHITSLSFCKNSVERQAGLARPGNTGENDEFFFGQVDIDTFEVVLSGPPDFDGIQLYFISFFPGPLEKFRCGPVRVIFHLSFHIACFGEPSRLTVWDITGHNTVLGFTAVAAIICRRHWILENKYQPAGCPSSGETIDPGFSSRNNLGCVT
jgi:hypothetical protein